MKNIKFNIKGNLRYLYITSLCLISSLLIYRYIPRVYKNLPTQTRIIIRTYVSQAKWLIFRVNHKFLQLDKCKIKEINKIPINSTLIIGHAYGSPYKPPFDISPNVYRLIDKNRVNINRVIFTGDVFGFPTL